MSYKDLLVVLDAGAPARGRIDVAAALAERFAAHLAGLYPLPIPQRPRELGYFDPAMLDPFFAEARERARDAADEVRERFEHITKLRGVTAEWRLIPEGPEADPAVHARYVDLTILVSSIPIAARPKSSIAARNRSRSPPATLSSSSLMPGDSRMSGGASWSGGAPRGRPPARSMMRCRC
jgi:hypothetical protein